MSDQENKKAMPSSAREILFLSGKLPDKPVSLRDRVRRVSLGGSEEFLDPGPLPGEEVEPPASSPTADTQPSRPKQP